MRTSLAMIACTLLWFYFSAPLHAAEKKPKPAKADGEIKAALAKVLPAAKACYDAESKNVKGLEGRITFSIKAGKDGSVDEVKVEKDELGSAPVAACIMGKLKEAKLPPTAKNKTLSHPFIFSPTRTLAILPFDNMTGDKALDWLKSGAPESLMTKLGQIPSLVLVDRLKLDAVINEQVLGQSGVIDEKTAIKAGKVVSAQLVIVGAFQKAGKKTRFTARVVDVETGKVRQIAEADGKLDDVFAVQDALAKRLCDTMNIMPTPETDAALALRVAGSAPLLELMGKASNALNGISEKKDVAKAELLYREVIAANPAIPESYVGLAYSLWWKHFNRTKDDTRNISEVGQVLAKAIELRPDYYEAVSALSFHKYLILKIDEAFEYARKAISLKPGYAQAYSALALAYASKGKGKEAVELTKRAVELDPNSSEDWSKLGMFIAIYSREYSEALPYTEKALQIAPNDIHNIYRNAYVHMMAGETGECLSSIENAVKLQASRKGYVLDDMDRYSLEAACQVKAGNLSEAKNLWEKVPKDVRDILSGAQPWPTDVEIPVFSKMMFEEMYHIVSPVLGVKQIK